MDLLKYNELKEEAKIFWMNMAKNNKYFQRQIRKYSKSGEIEIFNKTNDTN